MPNSVSFQRDINPAHMTSFGIYTVGTLSPKLNSEISQTFSNDYRVAY